MERAALGLVPHTGWAVLVVVAADRVVSRGRLVAVEPVEQAELYHLAAPKPPADAAAFLAEASADAAIRTADAVARTIAASRAEGLEVVAASVVGKQAKLADLRKIVASHPLVHGAEGELWRQLMTDACDAAGLAVSRVTSDGLAERFAGTVDVEAWLAAGKRALGAPWGREQHQAALAALGALIDHLTRSRSPTPGV